MRARAANSAPPQSLSRARFEVRSDSGLGAMTTKEFRCLLRGIAHQAIGNDRKPGANLQVGLYGYPARKDQGVSDTDGLLDGQMPER